MDGRDKPGHDEKRIGFATVIPGRAESANPESRNTLSVCLWIPGPALTRRPGMTTERRITTQASRYCNCGSPSVFFLASSISVMAMRISARVFKSGASRSACFSAVP